MQFADAVIGIAPVRRNLGSPLDESTGLPSVPVILGPSGSLTGRKNQCAGPVASAAAALAV